MWLINLVRLKHSIVHTTELEQPTVKAFTSQKASHLSLYKEKRAGAENSRSQGINGKSSRNTFKSICTTKSLQTAQIVFFFLRVGASILKHLLLLLYIHIRMNWTYQTPEMLSNHFERFFFCATHSFVSHTKWERYFSMHTNCKNVHTYSRETECRQLFGWVFARTYCSVYTDPFINRNWRFIFTLIFRVKTAFTSTAPIHNSRWYSFFLFLLFAGYGFSIFSKHFCSIFSI